MGKWKTTGRMRKSKGSGQKAETCHRGAPQFTEPRNSKPETRNPKPETRNPKLGLPAHSSAINPIQTTKKYNSFFKPCGEVRRASVSDPVRFSSVLIHPWLKIKIYQTNPFIHFESILPINNLQRHGANPSEKRTHFLSFQARPNPDKPASFILHSSFVIRDCWALPETRKCGSLISKG